MSETKPEKSPVAVNDVTGDKIKTRIPTKAYRDGWDRIFGSKKEKNNQRN